MFRATGRIFDTGTITKFSGRVYSSDQRGAMAPTDETNQYQSGDPLSGESSGAFSRYVITHCTICAAGWTRTGSDGSRVIVCLLDREPVWREMIRCDRFEPRPLKEATVEASQA